MQENIIVLDCSWYLPSQNINTKQEFDRQHIPGARFFDIDLVSNPDSSLPHMLPSIEMFTKELSRLGISNTSNIVVYDSAGLFSAARAWWTFRVFGHHNIRVLNGGLPAWIKQGGALENETKPTEKTNYKAKFNQDFVIDKQALIKNLSTNQYRVLDARSKERFLGTAPEPRADLASGHIPGSTSFNFSNLLEYGRLKPKQELLQLFDDINVNDTTPVVTSCGSGVTAAIITLALAECGFGLNRLYDGSWSEWAAADDTRIINRSL
jgi:thiosulfate/3-mercaptopyruvate sulfurtransferase